MKVTVIGAPPEDEEGVRKDLRDEWFGYCMMVYATAVVEPCFNEWIDGTYYLLPERLFQYGSRADWAKTVRLLHEEDIDTSFAWSPDPDHPLRRIARAWTTSCLS